MTEDALQVIEGRAVKCEPSGFGTYIPLTPLERDALVQEVRRMNGALNTAREMLLQGHDPRTVHNFITEQLKP